MDEASSNTTDYLRSETGRNYLSPGEEEIQGWCGMYAEKRLRVQKKTHVTYMPHEPLVHFLSLTEMEV